MVAVGPDQADQIDDPDELAMLARLMGSHHRFGLPGVDLIELGVDEHQERDVLTDKRLELATERLDVGPKAVDQAVIS